MISRDTPARGEEEDTKNNAWKHACNGSSTQPFEERRTLQSGFVRMVRNRFDGVGMDQ